MNTALDELTDVELAVTPQALIALDADGRVVAISPSAARWAGVSAWQVRGRALLGELGWLFGADAARRLADLLAAAAPCATLRAHRRDGTDAELTLWRGDRRIYLAVSA